MVVPIVLAMTARLSCLRSSCSRDKVVALAAVVIASTPPLLGLVSIASILSCRQGALYRWVRDEPHDRKGPNVGKTGGEQQSRALLLAGRNAGVVTANA